MRAPTSACPAAPAGLERDCERWDRQIEHDAQQGRLEPLFERALEAHRQVKSREL
jgi:hypothetical protein